MTRKWVHIAALLFLFLAGLALDATLQRRPAAEIDVGGQDLGFVEGFSAKEWSDSLPGPSGPERGTYRWMGAEGVLRLGPLRAGQPVVLRLRMFSGRVADASWPRVQFRAGNTSLGTFSLSPLLAEYVVLLPAEVLAGEDLVLTLRVEPFRVEGDPRDLGLAMERARVEAAGSASLPAFWPSIAALRPTYAVVLAAVVLGALALGVAFWPAWGAAAALLALVTAAALLRPEAVVQAGPTLRVLALLAAGLAGALWALGRRWREWARRTGERAETLLLVLFLLTLLLAFFPHIEADGIEYYAYLRSLAFDGDLHFANELSLDTPFPHVPYGLGAKKTVTGYEPNYASVGPAIAWTPFFVVGHLLALRGNALGLPWTVDGYSEPYVVLICFGSALSALVTLLLGYDLVRRLHGSSLGLLTTVATFFGTPLFYYAFYKPDFAHALAACAVMVFVYLWVRTWGRRTLVQWLWLGFAAGVMTALYWIDAVFIVLPALELLWLGVEALRARRWRALAPLALGGVALILAFLVAFSPQMIAWKVIFGEWFTVPQEGFATPSGFAALEMLLSPLHGLLPWTPIAVLGMLGLLLLAWEKRLWGTMALLGLLLFFLYNATLGSWHGGGYFGLRRLSSAFPFFLLGLAALLERVRRWRAEGALLLAALPTLWGLLVLVRYLVYAIPHYPQELEGLSLFEFVFAPGNMPVHRLPEVLSLSFFVRWVGRLGRSFQPADLLYGVILLVLFIGASLAVKRLLRPLRKSPQAQEPGK